MLLAPTLIRQTGRVSRPGERRRGVPAARAEYRFGLVLGLLLATFVFMMAGSTSKWSLRSFVEL